LIPANISQHVCLPHKRSRQERARSPLKGIIISIASHIIRLFLLSPMTVLRDVPLLKDPCSPSLLTSQHCSPKGQNSFSGHWYLANYHQNEIRIVQASLLGSILANLLLILGMCFLIGGLRYREQVCKSILIEWPMLTLPDL